MMLKLLLLAAFVFCGHGSEEDGGRVVGGNGCRAQSLAVADLPAVQLWGQWYHICGGTLVTPNWVMTAAHCMTSSRTLRVVVGEHDFSHNDGTEQYLSVGRVFMHPYWNSNNVAAGYDIALLQLSQNATLNSYVQPGALPGAGQILPNNYPCYITGWGLTRARVRGPLHCQVNGRYDIHGVTTFGSALSCNVSPKPIVFTRVSAYISWINSIINSN